MEALKSHEHLYLLLESDEAPMHASTLLLYEGGAATAPDIEAISAFMAARVSRARVLRRRLAALPLAVARPCWIDDPAVDIAAHVTAVNRVFENPMIAQYWNPLTDAGRAALDAMITQQAQIIAYIDDFKLMMIVTLAAIPLLLVFKKPGPGGGLDQAVAVE